MLWREKGGEFFEGKEKERRMCLFIYFFLFCCVFFYFLFLIFFSHTALLVHSSVFLNVLFFESERKENQE